MLKSCLILLAALLCATPASAQIYKWVDENGVVHYSDQPTDGAERIDIEQKPRTAAQRPTSTPPPQRPEPQPPAADDQPFSYKSFSVSSPASEQTLWNIGGLLNVTLSLSPGLRTGDQVLLYFDGEPRPIRGLRAELTEVWRGTHNLQAEVVDANGLPLIRSEPIRIYVQQTSVLN